MINTVRGTRRNGRLDDRLPTTSGAAVRDRRRDPWSAVVGLSRVAEPVLTLLFTGLAYGVLLSILSAILSPILLGHLDGPLANPVRLLPALAINAIWGLLAGAIALGLRRACRGRSDTRRPSVSQPS